MPLGPAPIKHILLGAIFFLTAAATDDLHREFCKLQNNKPFLVRLVLSEYLLYFDFFFILMTSNSF